MLRKALIAALILAILAFGISSGWIFNGHSSDEPEQTVTLTMPQIVLNDLVIRYGDGIEVKQGPQEVTREYLTYLVTDGKLKAVVWCDGLMYEVASVPLATPTPSPAGE